MNAIMEKNEVRIGEKMLNKLGQLKKRLPINVHGYLSLVSCLLQNIWRSTRDLLDDDICVICQDGYYVCYVTAG